MAKKILSTADLQAILDKADEKTDFKQALSDAIAALNSGDVAYGELKAANESLLGQNNELTNALNKAKSDFDQAAVNATTYQTENQILKGRVEDLENKITDKDDQLTKANALVAEMGSQLDITQKNAADGSLIVTAGGVQKKLIGNRFHFKGEEPMNAATLATRQDLLDKMAAKRSASLVDIEPAN